MPKYYVMDCQGKPPVADMSLIEEFPGPPWMTGKKVDVPDNFVFRYEIDEDYPGIIQSFDTSLSVPTMRKDLRSILDQAGVTNIQYFDAEIIDPDSGNINREFYAFNIVGLCAAADMGKSTLMHDLHMGKSDHDFDSLVLDQEGIDTDLLVFRLAENISAVIAHEKIKSLVEKAPGLDDMVFYDDGEWSG